MNITVLKARRIGSAIDNLLKEIAPTTNDRYGGLRSGSDGAHYIYDNVVESANVGNKKTEASVSRVKDLIDVKFYLRDLIDDFNFNFGISELQNEASKLKLMNASFQSLVRKNKSPSFSTANNKFSEGCSESFLSDIKTQIQVNDFKLQDVSDKCASINLTNTIGISEHFVSILKGYHLLS